MQLSTRNKYYILDVHYNPISTTKARQEKWLASAKGISWRSAISGGFVETIFIGCASDANPVLWHTTIHSSNEHLSQFFRGSPTYDKAFLDHTQAVTFAHELLGKSNWSSEGF